MPFRRALRLGLARRGVSRLSGRGFLRLGLGLLFRLGLGHAVHERPDPLPLLQIEHGQPATLLLVAHHGSRRDLLGVGRFGDVAGDVGRLRPLRLLRHEQEREAPVARERPLADALALGDLELRRRLALLLLLVALAARGHLLDRLEQLALLVLQELLALGELRLLLLRPHVGELDQHVARGAERHAEEVVVADEGRRLFARGEAGARLGARGSREHAPRTGDAVHQHDVAVLDEEAGSPRRVPLAGHSRRLLALLVRQPARLSARARDDVGGGLVLAGLAPLEEKLLRVAREAQAGGRIAHELGAAHDAVHAELEGPRLLGDDRDPVAARARGEPRQALQRGVGVARHLAELPGSGRQLQEPRALAHDHAPAGEPRVVLDAFGQAGEACRLPRARVELLEPPLALRDLAHEADAGAAGHRADAAAHVPRHHLGLAGAAIGELQRRRLAEHEQHQRVGVGPGVIAHGLHVGQQQLGQRPSPGGARAAASRPPRRAPRRAPRPAPASARTRSPGSARTRASRASRGRSAGRRSGRPSPR